MSKEMKGEKMNSEKVGEETVSVGSYWFDYYASKVVKVIGITPDMQVLYVDCDGSRYVCSDLLDWIRTNRRLNKEAVLKLFNLSYEGVPHSDSTPVGKDVKTIQVDGKEIVSLTLGTADRIKIKIHNLESVSNILIAGTTGDRFLDVCVVDDSFLINGVKRVMVGEHDADDLSVADLKLTLDDENGDNLCKVELSSVRAEII
jgi:hypothetical protein